MKWKTKNVTGDRERTEEWMRSQILTENTYDLFPIVWPAIRPNLCNSLHTPLCHADVRRISLFSPWCTAPRWSSSQCTCDSFPHCPLDMLSYTLRRPASIPFRPTIRPLWRIPDPNSFRPHSANSFVVVHYRWIVYRRLDLPVQPENNANGKYRLRLGINVWRRYVKMNVDIVANLTNANRNYRNWNWNWMWQTNFLAVRWQLTPNAKAKTWRWWKWR